MSRITSRQHALVRRCRRAATGRDDDGVVLLDGEHLVLDALAAGVPIDAVLATAASTALAQKARVAGVTIHEATADVLRAASPARTPSGVVALAAWSLPDADRVWQGAAPVVLGLVDVQDPGNVGAVIRAGDALGAGGVLALGESAHPAGWKALRGAMGSTFRLPVARGDTAAAVATARAHGARLAATVPKGGTPIDTADLTGPLLVLLGNEGAGLGHDVLRGVDVRLTIPMRPGVESLNVAVTAALVLWQARR